MTAEAPVPEGLDDYQREMEAKVLLAGMHRGDWLDAQVFPPLSWVVTGLIPEGATLVVGGPKVGKSWFIYGMGLAVAAKRPVLGGIEVEQRPVLYLALEDGDRRLQQRGRLLMDGEPLPSWFYYLTKVEPGDVVRTVEAWLYVLPEGYPRPLVIIDTLGKAMPPAEGNETTYLRDYRVASDLKAVADARPGMALVVLHHDRKAHSDDFVQMVSGTNGIAGAFDTILMLNRKRLEQRGTVKITGRDVPEKEYAVLASQGPWTLDGEDLVEAAQTAAEVHETEGLGERMRAVLAFVNEFPNGVTPRQAADALGLDRHLVSKYLSRLAEDERIAKEARGVYRRVDYVHSVDSLAVPSSEWTQSTESTPAEGETLACDVCGTTRNVLPFGDPHHVTRCKPHNPITYKETAS